MDQLVEFIGNHFILSAAFAALLTLLVVSEIKRATRGFNDLSPADATRMINRQNAVLLDVRSMEEHKNGAIVNSIHIPLESLSTQIKKLEKYKSKPIIAYCQSGQRSSTACAQLRKEGFEQIYHLRGGLLAWQRDSLPLVQA